MSKELANSKGKYGCIVIAIILTLIVVLPMVAATVLFGIVHGEEFSAMTFSRRGFTYVSIPFLGTQISPVWRKTTTNSLESSLRTDFFQGIPEDEESTQNPKSSPNGTAGDDATTSRTSLNIRWDIIRVRTATGREQQGAAACLCDYLTAGSTQYSSWVRWNQSHPKKARQFWLAVQKAAIDRLYFCIPDMFDLAITNETSSPDEFAAQLQAIVNEAAALRERAGQ